MVAEPTVCSHDRPVLEGYECQDCTRAVLQETDRAINAGVRNGTSELTTAMWARVESAWAEAIILACDSCAKGIPLRSWDGERREWVVNPLGLHHIHVDGSAWVAAVCPSLPLRERWRELEVKLQWRPR